MENGRTSESRLHENRQAACRAWATGVSSHHHDCSTNRTVHLRLEQPMSEREREENELARVEAEEERVIAESDRVEAEVGNGGSILEESRVVAETGRKEAEEDRVDAEVNREVAASEVYRRVTTLWAMRFALIFLIPVLIFAAFGARENQRLSNEIDTRCADTVSNRETLRGLIASGLEPLGYTYVPQSGEVVENGKGPIDYYKTHPAERSDALVRTLAILNDQLPPIKC